MELAKLSWLEIEDYLLKTDGIIVPTGSMEQHGPIGLMGTDTLCVEEIAGNVGQNINAVIAPALCYAPAEFNMSFPGTISISPETFTILLGEILTSLKRHGFKHIYILNGHGANLEPIHKATSLIENIDFRIKSWWDFDGVRELREEYFGDWEGMHATPAEISITQVSNRTIISSLADAEPRKLSKEYIKDHSGDKHGGPIEHREAFPDGRVGSHSNLARREYGIELMSASISAIQKDYLLFLKT